MSKPCFTAPPPPGSLRCYVLHGTLIYVDVIMAGLRAEAGEADRRSRSAVDCRADDGPAAVLVCAVAPRGVIVYGGPTRPCVHCGVRRCAARRLSRTDECRVARPQPVVTALAIAAVRRARPAWVHHRLRAPQTQLEEPGSDVEEHQPRSTASPRCIRPPHPPSRARACHHARMPRVLLLLLLLARSNEYNYMRVLSAQC